MNFPRTGSTGIIFAGSQKTLIDERVAALLEPMLPSLMRSHEEGFRFIKEEKERAYFEACFHNIGICLRAFLEIHSNLENMHLTFAMSKRYPWNNKTISKSQHLDLVWFQFVNLCYVFREKYKLSANHYNKLMKFFDLESNEIIHKGLKTIDKNLGSHIRDRGNHTHEWYVKYREIHIFSIVEYLHAHGTGADSIDVSGHYSDAKFFLSSDIKRSILFMENFMLTCMDGYIGHVGKILKNVSHYIQENYELQDTRTPGSAAITSTQNANSRRSPQMQKS